jgi:hypothetical protein
MVLRAFVRSVGEAQQQCDRLQAPDPATRSAFANVTASTLAAGYRAFVTVNNKAEGTAPLSVAALAGGIVGKRSGFRQSLAT